MIIAEEQKQCIVSVLQSEQNPLSGDDSNDYSAFDGVLVIIFYCKNTGMLFNRLWTSVNIVYQNLSCCNKTHFWCHTMPRILISCSDSSGLQRPSQGEKTLCQVVLHRCVVSFLTSLLWRWKMKVQKLAAYFNLDCRRHQYIAAGQTDTS